MKRIHCAVMHDGWPTNASHYLGVFSVLMKRDNRIEDGKYALLEKICMPLSWLSLLAKRYSEGEVESGYEIAIEDESHGRQVEHMFNYFHVYVHDWVVCQIAESCPLSKCMAEHMEKPHIGCYNHKLALQVNRIVYAPAYQRTVDSIRTAMRKCKSNIKTKAMLKRLNDLSPVLPCATRSSRLCAMVKRFFRICP